MEALQTKASKPTNYFEICHKKFPQPKFLYVCRNSNDGQFEIHMSGNTFTSVK